MKVIFLDIDGVLATADNEKMEQHPEFSYPFDPNCVQIFNRILQKTSAEIILTSDWRIHFNNDLQALDRLFKHNGIVKSPIDITPNFNKNRNKEITSYLHRYRDNIESLLVLDDMDLKIHSLRFIRCNLAKALKEPGIEERAIKILNSDQKNIQTCMSCEEEFRITNDSYCCSAKCRSDIEELKIKDSNRISDSEIQEYFVFARVGAF